MDRSFDICFESSSSTNERYIDRSLETSQGFASREISVLETKLQRRDLEGSSDGIHLTTSRTGRILDRSPDRRSPDPSLDKSSLNYSLDTIEGHSVRTGRTLERNSERKGSEAARRADVTVERTSDFLTVQPDSFTFNGGHLAIDAVNKNQSSKKSNVMSSQTHSTLSSSTVRDMLNKTHEQSQMDGTVTLDVVLITNRIISMTFPSDGHDTSYMFNLKEALRVLKSKHGDHFLIVNLSESHPDLTKAHPQVKEFGWPDHLAPPLERLCLICKSIDTWLSSDIRHIIVLHCKGGRSRLASVVAAYMHYNNICANVGQAVDSFAMKQYYDDKLGGLPLPSQRRYVAYFSGLLSGTIKINSRPLYLHHILIHGVPDFDNRGGCCPFIKVYQSMQPIFTSGVYNVTDNMQKVCISITPGIPLRGDILIKCYHKNARSGQKEVIWQCQFHTCAITGNQVVYSKQELDDAVLDPRFPDSGKVQFVFGSSSDALVSVTGFKSDVTVPIVDSEESMVRTDSYEEFNKVSELVVDVPVSADDFNKNRILSPPAPGGSTHVSQHIGSVDHHRAPDGSLYAAVNKREHLPPSTAANSGPYRLTNGSIASSFDSGHQGHDTSFNSHLNPTTVVSNNISSSISPSYTNTQQTSQRTVQTFDERMQLDELLSNLLNDQVYVSPTKDPSPSVQPPVQSQQAAQLSSPVAASDSIIISPVMNSAKTITTTTHTFTTYSATDAHRNPDNVLIQRSEVSYKVPGQGEVKEHYTDMPDGASSKPSQPYHPKGVPSNAFSYTSNTSNSQRADFVEHDVIRSQPDAGLQSPPTSQLTYYPRFEPKLAPSSSSQPPPSSDEATDSWLSQQQQKLKCFKEGRDPSGHSEQEKKLMTELQFAQNKYYTHVTQNTVQEKPHIDAYNRKPLHNGPTSAEGLTPSYTVPQSSSHVDGQWQDQFYNRSYGTYSHAESQTYADKQSHRPPPSPIMQRSLPATSAPLPVPARSSSKEFMRTFSNSSSSNWQQHHRPLQRQHSETLYDRNHDAEPSQPRRYESAHNTPPHSPPRVISPSGPASTTTYTAYRTMERQKESQDDVHKATIHHQQQQQQQVLPPQQQPAQVSHHYVTEVFVHRSDANKDKTDAVTHLEELEKNLEAASQSIKSSQQHITQQTPQQQMFQESLVSQTSHQYHTYQETVSREDSVSSLHHAERSMTQSRSQSPPIWDNVDVPEPPRVKEIEEDRIILRPIGPGVQTLEPENLHTGTLGRPSTPGFPTAAGGGQSLQSSSQQQQKQQHQQQHQAMQYQQYQTQQYQTQNLHHDGQGQNTLHIDTSPRMIYPSQSPSAGSPPSPGNFNTFRQQMSESVGSLGPHSVTGQSSPSVYYGLSRRGSLSSLTDSDMVHATPKFVKDTSKYWYKPNISREEAIQMLKDKPPGSFVIRDSNSFPGAYGLALKVATLPPNVQAKTSGDPQADLVRHFLIEPTPKGVRLRGCSNEPVFGSLAALVYQHSITPLALPWKLALPEPDAVNGSNIVESMSTTEVSSASTLLAQGAACNVIYVNSVDVESLTGPQAIAKAVKTTFENLVQGRTTMVHFKVFSEGITLTDNNRKLFFRRHYPVSAVTYCGMDPQDRRWKREMEAPGGIGDARLFGFVARKQGSTNENTCHIFAELDPEQPASAIVNFVTKVMIGQKN